MRRGPQPIELSLGDRGNIKSSLILKVCFNTLFNLHFCYYTMLNHYLFKKLRPIRKSKFIHLINILTGNC
jgi:hypothetical protein